MHLLVTWSLGAVALGGILLFPPIHLAIVAANCVAHFFVLGLQLVVSRFAVKPPEMAEAIAAEPFVSIHVPAHNEPPEVVLQTLRSLAQLKGSKYEVLVIDNNTADRELWKPLQEYCESNGPRFRFFHVEKLPGYKA